MIFRAENAEKRRETSGEKIGNLFHLCALCASARVFVPFICFRKDLAEECRAREWEKASSDLPLPIPLPNIPLHPFHPLNANAILFAFP